MSTPSISVVLPFRNAEATLSEAIESILTQTCTDWELLAIDDHSEDESKSIAESFAQEDDRVRVVSTTETGIVSALNTGIGLSQSPWIARMDADDISTPTRLEEQLGFAQSHPDITVVGCLVEAFPLADLSEGMVHYIAWLNALVKPDEIGQQIYIESPIAHPSAFVLRQAILDIGGYRDGLFPEDYDLWLRLHVAGARFGKVPKILFRWREHPKRLSREDPRYDLSHFRTLKVASLKSGFLRDHDQVNIWGAGPDGKALRKALLHQDIGVSRFFDVDPRKIGGRVAGEVLVSPWEEARDSLKIPLLCAVGVKGARAEIRAALKVWGFQEGREFLFIQ